MSGKTGMGMETRVECIRCGRKLIPDKVYIYKANVFCEECLMKAG